MESSTKSAITHSGIYSGEDYDATKEDMPWRKAIITSYNYLLESQKNLPVKVHEEIANRIFKMRKETGYMIWDRTFLESFV